MHSKSYKGKHLNVFQQMFRGVPYMSGSDPASKAVLGALALFIVVMGLSVSFTMFVVLATSASMLGFAGFLASWVLAKDEGVPEMQVVSEAIREGSEGFFKTQYGTIRRMSMYLGAGIFALYLFRSDAVLGSQISSLSLAIIVTMSFS